MMNAFHSNQDHAPDPSGLRDALSRLPEHAPATDTWTRIRTRALAGQRKRRLLRRMIPLAAAATLLLALGLPMLRDAGTHAPDRAAISQSQTAAHTKVVKSSVSKKAESLASLQSRSMRMEQWLTDLRANGAPLQGSTLARAVALQDRIGLIDLQLSASGDAAASKVLWQHRVDLLQDLAMLRVSQSPISDQRVMAERRSATIQL